MVNKHKLSEIKAEYLFWGVIMGIFFSIIVTIAIGHFDLVKNEKGKEFILDSYYYNCQYNLIEVKEGYNIFNNSLKDCIEVRCPCADNGCLAYCMRCENG